MEGWRGNEGVGRGGEREKGEGRGRGSYKQGTL